MIQKRRTWERAAALLLTAIAAGGAVDAWAKNCARTSTGLVPISDLGTGLYLGRYQGGLYPGGLNQMPPAHESAGKIRAARIQPLDVNGLPAANGRYVLLSIGMSNTTQEYCGGNPCRPGSFGDQAARDARVNSEHLAIVDGARGGQTAGVWTSPDSPEYNRIRDQVLAQRGLSEAQVQAVWLKVANPAPTVALPEPDADAFLLLDQMGDIARTLKIRYPNLQEVFLSSRIYAGYADTALNPEPYAYESGFACKWLIEAQIRQTATGQIDPIAGDLALDAKAPWLAWGPYLWADGLIPRQDGMIWACADFANDGTHPAQPGWTKVGSALLLHFLDSLFTRDWFRQPGGGGIPCEEVKKLNAKCPGGTLSVKLVLTTKEHEGETVAIRINNLVFEAFVQGKKANWRFENRQGAHTITLVSPPNCLPPKTVDCTP